MVRWLQDETGKLNQILLSINLKIIVISILFHIYNLPQISVENRLGKLVNEPGCSYKIRINFPAAWSTMYCKISFNNIQFDNWILYCSIFPHYRPTLFLPNPIMKPLALCYANMMERFVSTCQWLQRYQLYHSIRVPVARTLTVPIHCWAIWKRSDLEKKPVV